jgi:hypothetical protein
MPLIALVRTAASLSPSITAPFQRRESLLLSRELLQKCVEALFSETGKKKQIQKKKGNCQLVGGPH